MKNSENIQNIVLYKTYNNCHFADDYTLSAAIGLGLLVLVLLSDVPLGLGLEAYGLVNIAAY